MSFHAARAGPFDPRGCMQVSDYEINAKVRSVLARHWVDTVQLRFGSFRGTVRLTGELHRLGGQAQTEDQLTSNLSDIEQEIRRIRGVRNVYIHLDNCTRNTESGAWEIRTGSTRGGSGSEAADASVQGSEGKVYELTTSEKAGPGDDRRRQHEGRRGLPSVSETED